MSEVVDNTKSKWVTWRTSADQNIDSDTSWISELRLKSFQFILFVGCTVMTLIVVRALFVKLIPTADILNLFIFLILLIALKKYPEKLQLFSWIGMFVLLLNMLDGLRGNHPEVINPSYILFPMLVMYSTFLGDMWMTCIMLITTLIVFITAGIVNHPMNEEDFMTLTNLIILVIVSGVSSIVILYQHKRLAKLVHLKAEVLREELNTNIRLNSLIFHDINNPLSVISGTAMLLNENDELKPPETGEGLKVIEEMSSRISNIINSAKRIENGKNILIEDLSVQSLFNDISQLFSSQLKDKRQQFIFEAKNRDITIRSNREILRNSVLSNFMSNAIKFSPEGSKIVMRAEEEDEGIRISVISRGEGFPDSLLKKGEKGERYGSSQGTEGEFGTAFGLIISAMCLNTLNGLLQIRNLPEGGAEVSALLRK